MSYKSEYGDVTAVSSKDNRILRVFACFLKNLFAIVTTLIIVVKVLLSDN